MDTPEAELASCFDRMRDQGGGVWRLAVVGALNLDVFDAALAAGDEDALQTRTAISRALATLHSFARPTARAPMCLLCPSVLWRGFMPCTIAVIAPACDEPERAVVNFVCRACCERFADASELQAALVGFFRGHLAPAASVRRTRAGMRLTDLWDAKSKRLFHKDYRVLSESQLSALHSGDLVQLCRLGEEFWVEVSDCYGKLITGALKSELTKLKLSIGTPVVFERENVLRVVFGSDRKDGWRPPR